MFKVIECDDPPGIRWFYRLGADELGEQNGPTWNVCHCPDDPPFIGTIFTKRCGDMSGTPPNRSEALDCLALLGVEMCRDETPYYVLIGRLEDYMANGC